MFNNTSRYLDDIFTIDNPEFEKYIPDIHDIYSTELQSEDANTSDKETPFLDLNIKYIGSVDSLIRDVTRITSYGLYISQLVKCAMCCTSVLDFHSKYLQINSKLLTDHTLSFYSKVKYHFKNMVLKEFIIPSSTVI